MLQQKYHDLNQHILLLNIKLVDMENRMDINDISHNKIIDKLNNVQYREDINKQNLEPDIVSEVVSVNESIICDESCEFGVTTLCQSSDNNDINNKFIDSELKNNLFNNLNNSIDSKRNKHVVSLNNLDDYLESSYIKENPGSGSNKCYKNETELYESEMYKIEELSMCSSKEMKRQRSNSINDIYWYSMTKKFLFG